MLRVATENIEPGMILARPIPSPHESRGYLLPRDRAIPMDLVPRLLELGVREVWIRYRPLEFLEELIDEGLDEHQREVYAHVRQNFESVMNGASLNMDASHFQSSISSLFDYLKSSTASNVLLQKLDAYDNYLMSHSTNVCYLALLLGMKLDWYLIEERQFKTARDAKDVQLLGLGCLLHDVGKMKIPPEILHKPGRLTQEEMDIVKMHPIYGHEMVKGQVAPAAAEVVMNHHQRWDGRGYPRRIDSLTGEEFPPLAGRSIPIFSRIATMADVYDAATSKRCYSQAKPPVQVLHEMKTCCKGYFDPVVEKTFYEIIPPFPIGQVVQLSNEVEAAVVDFNPQHPLQPKVQGIRDPYGTPYRDPNEEEIDLALHDDLAIVSIGKIDVRPFQPALKLDSAPAR